MLDFRQAFFANGVEYLAVGRFKIVSFIHILLHHAAYMVQHIINKPVIGQSRVDQIGL